MKRPCVFLDRDGVLNRDRIDYVYRLSHFALLPGVPDALYRLKTAGYLLVVVTNQSGIAQGLYSERDMRVCHIALQQACDHVFDHFYFCAYHPSHSASLARKPGSLMFEKAIARYNISIDESWMIGDRARDIIPARALGLRTLQVGSEIDPDNRADHSVADLPRAADVVLGYSSKR